MLVGGAVASPADPGEREAAVLFSAHDRTYYYDSAGDSGHFGGYGGRIVLITSCKMRESVLNFV